MKPVQQIKERNFKEILKFCSSYKDAMQIARHLDVSDMTARKYMRTLLDMKMATYIEKSHNKKEMRKIKSSVTIATEDQLNALCAQYKARFIKNYCPNGKKLRPALDSSVQEESSAADDENIEAAEARGICKLLTKPSAYMRGQLKKQSEARREENRRKHVSAYAIGSTLKGSFL